MAPTYTVGEYTASSYGTVYTEPWYQWVAASNTTTGTYYDISTMSQGNGTSQVIWVNWVNSTVSVTGNATGSTISDLTLWRRWVQAPINAAVVGSLVQPTIVVAQQSLPRTPETPEEIEARQRRLRRTSGIRKARRLSAERRSRELLLSLLDARQRLEFELKKTITVRHQVSGRRFRIHCTKRTHNVFELDRKGAPLREYCIVAPGNLPDHDNLAAQLLMLQADLVTFERTANVWDLQPNGGRHHAGV